MPSSPEVLPSPVVNGGLASFPTCSSLSTIPSSSSGSTFHTASTSNSLNSIPTSVSNSGSVTSISASPRASKVPETGPIDLEALEKDMNTDSAPTLTLTLNPNAQPHVPSPRASVPSCGDRVSSSSSIDAVSVSASDGSKTNNNPCSNADPHSQYGVCNDDGASGTGTGTDSVNGVGDAFKSPNVYINGLPPHYPEDHLFELCSGFGEIRSVRSFTRHVGEKESGYGFVL